MDLVKNVANTRLKKKILAYLAIKIIANPSLPYSTLNPETSWDSPSAKSKGVRFVSATQDTSQIITIGRNSTIYFNTYWVPWSVLTLSYQIALNKILR